MTVYLVKDVSARPRPADIMVETATMAFPSGHAARMAAFVVIIAAVAIPARYLKVWWPIGVLLTFAMMLARNWQHAHWLTDTIAGAALGWGVAALAWWAMTPLLDRERALREGPVPAEADAGATGASAERLSWWHAQPVRKVPYVDARPLSPAAANAAAAPAAASVCALPAAVRLPARAAAAHERHGDRRDGLRHCWRVLDPGRPRHHLRHDREAPDPRDR
jgi:hypothetical protein